MNSHSSNYTGYSSIVEVLTLRSLEQPKQTGFIWLKDGEIVEYSWTYQDLEQRAKTIASTLQSLNAKGSRALLLYPPGLEFIAAFFGCLYAGVIAVPAYPPRHNQSILRLQSIATDSQSSFVLSTSALLTNIQEQLTKDFELPIEAFLATDNLDISLASEWQELALNNEYLAFLQYTSGSTGKPKGVMVSHGNLLHNLEQISQSFEPNASSYGVFWLPSYHDMGLIGGILQPLYRGFTAVLMSPISFLQSPLRWLQAISRYKATFSGGPNFAYDLCVNKITPEQRVDLDLSSWTTAFTGAEQIRAETLEKFATAFADCGFRREAFYPCYGMAEGTLFITGGTKANAPVIKTVDAEALAKNHIVSITTKQENFRKLIGCGHAWSNQKLVLVNPENLISCADGQVGEIWVSGLSIAQGYWNAPEQTEEIFRAYLADTGEGPFLRTGDLGFVQDGELFVTGRLKDLIIIRGRNYYPQDIELTVEQSSPSVLRLNCSATFSIEIDGEEKLVVVTEVVRRYWKRRSDKTERSESVEEEKRQSDRRQGEADLGVTSEVSLPLDTEATIKSIRQKVAEEHQLQAYAIILIKPGSIPKTSSGKIQRYACRDAFLAGTLEVMASSILGQMPQSSVTQTAEPDAAARSDSSRQFLLELDLCNEIGRILRISSDQLTAQDTLNSLGLDSLKVVEIKNYLETKYGLSLPIEVFLEQITISKIASWILSETESPATIAPSTPKVAIETLIKGVEDIKPLDDAARSEKPAVKAVIEFSLFYFSSNEAEFTDDKYRLLIEGAKFADQQNFTAVWIPERHFHAFGGIYPNPSVLAAALAMVTKRVRLRAGSVVLPMHNPVRVAEEWSVIDNLSDGRVDIGFAAGWNPNDFVLAPENYANRTEILFSSMQTVKKLWRGESICLPNGVGKQANIRIYPLPIQSELPVWTTCTGGKERFIEAGAAGTNILTALLFQSIEELAEKVSIYREARYKNGHDPDSGHVTLMLHTFIGEDIETIRATVKQPFIEYLKSSVNLWRQNAESLDDLNEKGQQELLNYAFERYFQTSALFGTPTSCLEKIERLKEIGINEIACLIDFGVDTDSIMASLYSLKKLKNLANEKSQIKKKVQPSFTVSHHYDVISQFEQVLLSDESYLTFGIFSEKIPKFSWILTFYKPEAYPEQAKLALQSQIELRNILFKNVDFSKINQVLDFGCGYASDILYLAKKYPHLQLTGYTISPKQAELDEQKIAKNNLSQRIKVYNGDSAKDDFPYQYDLIFGFEVAVYIKNKQDLFANISSNLNEGGTLLLAEFIAHTLSTIEHAETSSYIITAQEWLELFSKHNLKIVECVEISQEVSNFLFNPNFEENLTELDPAILDTVVKAHFASWNNLGKLLDSKLASYVLLRLQKDISLSTEEIRIQNESQLKTPIAYTDIKGSLAPSLERRTSFNYSTPYATIDLNAEAVLDEAIHPHTTNTAITEEPSHIFLTGATGFLGAFLLDELLQQTSASIHCLVRANSPEMGKERIQANLEKYSLWNLDLKDRIIAVIGDISKPLLGLNSEQFDNLAQQIDWIYHNAALLNFVYPYSALKPANVLGTQEVLRLACQGKVKPVHYISSTAVFDSADYTGKIVTENEELVNPNGMLVGYAQSKWVAEKLVTIARERGLPVTIYRPAWIFGHTQTGICNTADFICRIIKGCIQMGSMPDIDYVWNISPVDYVSRATIHLSKQQVIGKVFHLISPHPLYWNELVDWIGSFGYPVKHIPYQEWQSKLRSTKVSENNPLYPLVPLFLDNRFEDKLTIPQLYQQGRMPELDCQETLKLLREAELVCPPVDQNLLKTYFTYFTDSGFLPQNSVNNQCQ